MIHSRTIKFFTITLLIAAAAFLIHKSWNFSKVYPFSRITVGSTLLHSTQIFDKDEYFKHKILSINYKQLNNTTAIKRFGTIENFISTTISYNGKPKNLTVISNDFNTGFFIFNFFLILIGCIHFIWGLMVYFIRQIYASARYYSRFSINFGLLYLAIVYYLVSDNYFLLLITAASLFYQLIKMLLEMSHISQRRTLGRFFLLCVILITLFLINTSIQITPIQAVTFYLALIIISASLFGIFIIKKNLGNRFRNQTTYFILIAGVIGILIPFVCIGMSIHFDFPVPFSIISLITIITPVIVGRNFIEQSQINELISRKIYSLQFSIDFMTGITISILLSIFFRIPDSYTFIYSLSAAAAGFMIFTARFYFLRNFKTRTYGQRDIFTESLQKITETSVIPEPFDIRLEHILSEVTALLDTHYISIGLLSHRDKNLQSTNRSVFSISPSSPLASFYRKCDDIIRRDLLFNQTIEDSIQGLNIQDKAYILVPAKLRNEVSGVLFVGERKRHIPFFKDDINYLSAVGTLVFQMIENEALFNQTVTRGKYEKELDNASYIQMRLFPAYVPPDRGFETSIYYRPFNKVTGDIIDFIPIDTNRTAIFIGDITGHGLPAAMVHSTTIALISSLIKEGKDLEEVMKAVNTFLINGYRGHELVTLFGCILNKEDFTLKYINAGHPMPFIISPEEKTIQHIESRGHILGVMDNPFYCTSTVQLARGMQLLFYTDGIVEIQKHQSDMNIGTAYLEETLKELIDTTIEEKTEQIVHYIDKTDQSNISDDITFAFIEIE